MDENGYESQNRLAEALRIRGMKQVELAEKTGISRGTINNWLKQRYQPKQKSLFILAQALNVTEMWLAGYDTPMERPAERVRMDTLAQSLNVIRKDEKLSNIAILLPKLTEGQKATIESMVNELVKLNQQSQ